MRQGTVAHHRDHISLGGVEALRAILNGKPIWNVYAPEVQVGFNGAPHLANQLVFRIGLNDFVVFTTRWGRSRVGFDQSTFEIERSARPGRVPYDQNAKPHLNFLGPVSSLEVHLGVVMLIEVIEACCTTTPPLDDDPETIEFDYGLQFFGTEGSLLLTTMFHSIRRAIEVRKGAEPELNESVDAYRTRLLLDRGASHAEVGTA